MSKIQKWLTDYWAFNISVLLSIAALIAFLWYKLVDTPHGYSPLEWLIRQNLVAKAYTFHYLWNNVVFAPYYLALMIPQYLDRYGLFSIRSVGDVFGLISVVIFFYINWRWWGTFIAVLSTILYTTSFWFLIVSRNTGPQVLYVLAALIIILLGFVVRNEKRHETKTLLSALLALVLLYIPGMVWFILIASILQRKLIIKEFKKLPVQVKYIIPLASIIIVVPLVHGCLTNYSELKTILGFPVVFSMHTFLKNLLYWPLIIFIRSPINSLYSIGHLAILSIFVDVMFVLGLYWIWLKRKLDRFYLLGATIILSWVLYAIGGPVSIYLSIPFIICIAATGLAFLISQWFTVFPKNPVARTVGMVIVVIAIISVSYLNINQYFVAWPNTTSTIAVYSTHS
jgi:hypothetical protein